MDAQFIGRKVRLEFHTAARQTVRFSGTIIRVNDDDTVTVRIPERVRGMKWCPWPQAAYKFRRAAVLAALTA